MMRSYPSQPASHSAMAESQRDSALVSRSQATTHNRRLTQTSLHSSASETRNTPPLPQSAGKESSGVLDLSSAIEAYRTFRYKECLGLLDEILSTASPNDREYIDALAYAGAASFMLHDNSRAAAHFSQIPRLDCDYMIDADEFPPELIDFFEAQRRSDAR